MQIDFALPMTVFDTDAVKLAFEHFIAKCDAEVAKGDTDYYQAYADRLRDLLELLDATEAEAVRRATRRR
jgi:hypothetical protein